MNLKNHLPFADKSQPDILKSRERYTTLNQERTHKDALRQTSADLTKNLEVNNTLNKQFKSRLLTENHKMGLQSKAQELDNLRSEQMDRQQVIRSNDAQTLIRQELRDKINANQLRFDNKRLVEAQNFNIK